MLENTGNQLFLLLVSLGQVRDSPTLIRLFTESLSKLFEGLVFVFTSDAERSGACSIDVGTASMHFGRIEIRGPWEALPSDLMDLIRNAVKMLALVLENRFQDEELARENERLEATVAKRTADLLEANRVLHREIVERKKAEESLREKTEEVERYFALSLDLLCIADTEGHFVRLNPEWEKTLGYPLSELEGKRFIDFVHQDDVQATLDAVSELKNQRQVLCFENRYRCKDGSYRWIEWRSRAKGTVIYAAARDITSRKLTEEALRTAELRYRAVFQTAGVGIAVVNSDGKIIQANTALTEMLGYSPEELLGLHVLEITHPDDVEASTRKHEELIRGERESYRLEKRYVRKDGQVLWADLSVSAIRGTAGAHMVTIGVVSNITDRKRAELALERRLMALTRPLDDADGIEFTDLFNLEEIQELQDQFAQATGVASIITHPDGTPITKASNFCRLCRDIIRNTEQGLINCYRSDAEIGSYHPGGPVVRPCLSGGLWDAGASISVGGRHAANWLIGQVRNELQTEQQMRDYAREIGANEEEVVSAFREVNQMSLEQFQGIAQALWAFANLLSKMAYQNVQQARFIAQGRKAEEEKDRLHAQLLQAQKMEAVGTLAGGIAHDFNNLLQVISGFAELALFRIGYGKTGYSELCEIKRAAHNAAELTQGLLAFSRRVESNLRPVDLNQEVQRITKMLHRTLPRMIRIGMDLSEPLDTVNADPAQLQQVVMNLAVNARDAMPKGGTLSIQTKNVYLDEQYCRSYLGTCTGSYVLLSISDSGTGMDDRTRKHIFDPFFTTKETGKGTGLGLSIAFGIIKSHGGNLLCYSEPGHGTTFKIYLPAAAATPDLAEKRHSKDLPWGKETILLVDDEEKVRKLASQVLEEFGYSVLTACNGKEGVMVFSRESQRIDLVILDLIMPEMGGRDCLREIKALAPDTKVIIASGFAANGEMDLALSEGARIGIKKPYEARQLLETVRRVLDARVPDG